MCSEYKTQDFDVGMVYKAVFQGMARRDILNLESSFHYHARMSSEVHRTSDLRAKFRILIYC